MEEEKLEIAITHEEIHLAKNRKIFKRAIFFFIIILLIGGSFYFGYHQGQKSSAQSDIKAPLEQTFVQNKLPTNNINVDFSLFWKVWDLVKEKHVDKDKLDAQQMVYGAINGMLHATGDPYSTFFSPEDSKSFSQEISGSFEGIGAEMGIKDDVLTIIAPLDGSPSQKAGLLAGDKVLKIDGKSTSDITTDQAVDLIRGKKGTSVTLTILHSGDQVTKDISITRDTIEVKSVTVDFKDNNIAYVKISQFSDNTDTEFNDVVNQIISHSSKGIIIDLRNNPGGLLDKAVAIASTMIPVDKVVVMEEDSDGNRDSIKTTGGDRLSSIPIVVLINQGSASASEILAGALHDDQGVTLVGKTSFGKGSVQELMDLPGGSSVKITVAKWLTPNGDYIMEKGITPDIPVDITQDDYNNNRDPQLDKAMDVIKQKMGQ